MSNFINLSNMTRITTCDAIVYDYMAQPPNEITPSIIEAVSEAVETPVETLPPIMDAIEVDALETLITGNPAHDVTVTFSYAGLRVLVHSGQTVYVRPLQSGPDGPRSNMSDDYDEDRDSF